MFGLSKRELLRIIERERAQHRLELANLLDRLANAAGTPWTPPPVSVDEQRELLEEVSYTFAPEQDPLV